MTFRAISGTIRIFGGISTVTESTLTMNPADKTTQISLSNGNLTYTTVPSSYNGIRAINSTSSGQWYWEVFLDFNDGGTNSIQGVMTASADLGGIGDSKWVGFDVEGWGFFGSGGWNGGAAIGSTLSFADINDVMMFALDITNGKIWFGVNGSWNGGVTPTVDGSGAFYANLVGKTVFPAGSVVDSQIATSRFKDSDFTYSPPTGFSAINAIAGS